MAKRHLVEYYLNQFDSYLAVNNELKEMQELVDKDELTEDEIKGVQDQVNIVKTNLDNIAYALFLLNKPNRNKSRATKQYFQYNKDILDYFVKKGVTQDQVTEENMNILKALKKFIANKKNNC